MIVSPPRLVGTRTVCPIFGIGPYQVRDRLKLARPGDLVRAGYIGKINDRHVWNLHELIATLFTGEAALELVVDRLTAGDRDPLDTVLCGVPGCDELEEMAGLCRKHLRRLTLTFKHAGRSSLITVQLVAMCRWVVDRNEHLVLADDYDPFAPVCMTPGCGQPTNHEGWRGPLCPGCAAKFWNNAPTREHPRFWKDSAA